MIMVVGRATTSHARFSINFIVGSNVDTCEGTASDIAFQFNPRFKEHVVVRNSKMAGVWGREERLPHGLPLTPGMTFELLFLVQEDSFKVAVDGKHFVDFHHRMPYQAIGMLQVDGEVTLERVTFSHEPSFPSHSFVPPMSGTPVLTGTPVHTGTPVLTGTPVHTGTAVHTGPLPLHGMPVTPPVIQGVPVHSQGVPLHSSPSVLLNPPIPLVHLLPQGLSVGQTIYVSGSPGHAFDSFRIDLLRSHTFDPSDANAEIALHFSVRRLERTVVRNTWLTGMGWGTEERAAPPFPFHAEHNFDMMIRVLANRFEIAINGKHFVDFAHRLQPVESINLLQIKGAVFITSVRIA